MRDGEITCRQVGPFRAWVSPRHTSDPALAAMAAMDKLLQGPGATVMAAGRNRLVRIEVPGGGEGAAVWMVKAFGGRGDKARRSWQVAQRLFEAGVGTPEPVACLEREGGAAPATLYVSRFVPDLVSMRDELVRLFHDDPECERFMRLLQRVADAVRGLHAAGVQHNDLGNQNILLRRVGSDDWADVQFVDLNRARLRESLSPQQRGRDLSRIALPSELLRVFREMYCDAVPTAALLKWERFYRRRYAVHAATRAWRHPWRERLVRAQTAGERTYPEPRELWIWDERSAQAISTMTSRDRARHYPLGRNARIAADTLLAAPGVWTAYRQLMAGTFGREIVMAGRVGVALDPVDGRLERERALVGALGHPPLLVRLYHHESPERFRQRLDAIRGLTDEGRRVFVALVQDRRAVREPASWRRFLEASLAALAGRVDGFELGHAINRVKWGVWTLEEWLGLMLGAREALASYPGVTITGPAGIDFEYPYVASALRHLPEGLHFGALSHHLYVDRRGAPENAQGAFSAIEKFALARALARVSPHCDDRLIVSEVNWPILGTGLYSPVNSPYASPGERRGDPSVTEAQYADYMVRYLLAALCSGMVERVYWWRLVARGFGLVDDSDNARWRERPAFAALRHFLAIMRSATFVRREVLPAGAVADGLWRYVFRTDGANEVVITFAREGTHGVEGRWERITDVCGVALDPAVARVTGSPLYLS